MEATLKTFNWLAPFQDKLPETPFYLYSEQRLEELWHVFSSGIKNSELPIRLHFPTKTNHNPEVLSFFRTKGCGADVVSGYELEFCLKNSFKGEDILFSSSGKSNAELELAIKNNLKMICIESRSEFTRLRKLCKEHGKVANVSFRVNPNVDAETHPYISTGLYGHKFGIDLELAIPLFEEASRSPELNLIGISTHIGSQVTKVSIFDETLKQLLDFTLRLAEKGIKLQILDLGGGLGIDYKSPNKIAAFEAYTKTLCDAAKEWKEIAAPNAHIITECGRALCAQAGVIVTKLIATKKTPYKNFAIVDVSMTELMRPCLYQSEHLFERVSPHSEKKSIEWQIAGPVCETTDVLVKSYMESELEEGEVFLVQQAGAYGYVMANNYNLRPLPAEWWISSDGKAKESRARRPFF
ncbi:diaminopimelate decarboxylase [bacterium]|nr:diaminopimelate decarboxylase [bacterium]